MIFNSFKRTALFAGLALASSYGPVVAQEIIPAGVPVAFTYVPYGETAYTETVSKRPGTCLLAVLGLIGTKLAYDKYKDYHNTRAKTRRQLWMKIQQECYTFSTKGVSESAKVRDFSDQNIANALIKKKADWLADARGISNWGLFQDKRLTALIEEFFLSLQTSAANVQVPVAAVPQASWWKFWIASRGQRPISLILPDIEECLMGSCG